MLFLWLRRRQQVPVTHLQRVAQLVLTFLCTLCPQHASAQHRASFSLLWMILLLPASCLRAEAKDARKDECNAPFLDGTCSPLACSRA